MADVKSSIAALVAAAALGGGVYEGTVSYPPADKVSPNEVISARTINSRTVLTNKTYNTLISSQPMHWRDGSALKTIDATVRRRPFLIAWLSKYEFESYIGPAHAVFDSVNATDYAVSLGDCSIEYTMLESKTPCSVQTEVWNDRVKQTFTVVSSDEDIVKLQWLLFGGPFTLNADGSVIVKAEKDSSGLCIAAPIAWDSNMNSLPLTVSISGDTLSYSVTVKSALFPIKIDPTTVVAELAGSYGMVFSSDASTWANVRNTPSANQPVFTSPVGIGRYVSAYRCLRYFTGFDASSIPDGANITSAFMRAAISFTDHRSLGNFFTFVVKCNSTGAVDTSWFNDFPGWASSGAYSVTKLSNDVSTAGSVGDSVTWTLNSTGLTNISKTVASYFAFLSSRDVSDTTAPATNDVIVYGGGSLYLSVTYSLFTGKVSGVSIPSKVSSILPIKVSGVQ